MRILIDIGHPAHVHYFKHFAWEMLKKGHHVFFTCRGKEFEIYLLNYYGFPFKSFGKKYLSITGKIWGMIEFDIKEFLVSIKFKPDIFLSAGSIYAAHASWLTGKPHITLEDTFNFEQVRLYKPFTKVILTGDYDHPALGAKEIRYKGYHELAYLHPNYFTPDPSILKELDIKESEKYVIIRFVSWHATHDFGHKGISFENKLKAVKEFEKYAKVFISSESVLPSQLEPYRIKIAPPRMHDAMAFASLLFGESATMAEECAMLGVPACIIYKHKTYYTQHLGNDYNLLFNYTLEHSEQLKAIEKGEELLNTPNLKEQWQKKRQRMLADKIDVTAFLVWFVENYPESVRIMQERPGVQDDFK